MVTRAKEGLQLLSKEGFKFIVISNQVGICRGMVSDQNVRLINQK